MPEQSYPAHTQTALANLGHKPMRKCHCVTANPLIQKPAAGKEVALVVNRELDCSKP